MNCGNCDCVAELYELLGSKNCEDCWKEYFLDNEIYIDTSWNDYLKYTLKKVHNLNLKRTGGNKHEN